MNNTVAESPVGRSISAYRMILDDVEKNYSAKGGGGISSIRETALDTYVARIAQEERSDVLTYRFRKTAKGLALVGRTDTTDSH